MNLRLLTLLLTVLCSASPVLAQVTRVVDDDGQGTAADCDAATPALSKVVDAIEAAGPGDTVLVCPGTYLGSIDFVGKAITVRSLFGAAATVLDASVSNVAVVRFQSGETAASVLEGFMIRSSFGPSGLGGGIRIIQASPIIRGNIIAGHHACTGSGIFIQSGSAVIEDNTIESNSPGCGCETSSTGGGIAVAGNSTVIIRRNTIRNNASPFGFGAGGGIALSDAGTPTIERNIISTNSGRHGGGIALIGLSNATIAGNLIVRNNAVWAGGIYWLVPSGARGPLVVNNTIAANDGPDGSGVFADGADAATALYNNNIVAFAGQAAVSCGLSNDLNPPVFRFNNVFSATGARYTGICTDQTGVNGNISADPLFLNAASGDYQLRGASPAVDAGDDSLPGVPALDLDGHPRVIDGNADGVAIVDIGAYEALPPVRGVVLDAPAPGNVGAAFVASGWAVDGRGADTGVDAVHLWVFPEGGGAPTFLGAAEYGLPRDDVAAAVGESRFTNSGFRLTAPPVIGSGSYVLVAYARTTETGIFELTARVRITVPSLPFMSVDRPEAGATIGTSSNLSGWAIDYASLDGPGVDAVHAYAYPATGGAPIFLGAADYGLARPDVGAAFGADRFDASGWALRAELSPGDYRLAVYARSTVAQAFNQVVVRDVTVVQSRALIAIDVPTPDASVGQPFNISGWAIDLASESGPGVYTVHAYAFPSAVGPPIYLGAATYGTARPDVAAAFGHARFTNSGYTVTATGLPAGTYLLAAYAGSYVVNDFTAVHTVTVTVAASPIRPPE